MNISEQIASLIPLNHCFLLPGGGNAPLVEAFADKAVCCLHEHTCTVAAEAYAQLKGLGLALVTTGPGVTNAMTGLAAAWLDGTPLVLLSGQVKREYMVNPPLPPYSGRGMSKLRQRGFQELPNEFVTKQIVKDSCTIVPEYDWQQVNESILDAKTPRCGPVHLDIPLDVQTSPMGPGPKSIGQVYWRCEPDKQAADAAVQRAVELLRRAERPVLLLGHGARCENVRELVEAIGLPTLLTWRAADFLEDEHPLFCGRPGIAGQLGANMVQQQADLLICVGARLDLGQTGYDVSLFAPNAMKLVIDIDEAEARKHRSKYDREGGKVWWDHAVCDGPSFLRELSTKEINGKIASKHWYFGGMEGFWSTEWSQHCRATFEKHRPRNEFYDALSDALRPDDVIVAGSSGTAAESTLQHIKIKRGQRLIFSPGLGAMGFGLPASIGAAFATGRRVVCIEGDGSFAMNAYELETVRRYNLPIKVFVIRNGGYASIVRSQKRAGYKECVPSVPDMWPLAQSIGIEAWNTRDSLSVPLSHDRPRIICVDVDCSLSHRMRTIPPGKPEDMVKM